VNFSAPLSAVKAVIVSLSIPRSRLQPALHRVEIHFIFAPNNILILSNVAASRIVCLAAHSYGTPGMATGTYYLATMACCADEWNRRRNSSIISRAGACGCGRCKSRTGSAWNRVSSQRDSSVWYLRFPYCVTDIGPSRLTTWRQVKETGFRLLVFRWVPFLRVC
jgi:hypothetical protein